MNAKKVWNFQKMKLIPDAKRVKHMDQVIQNEINSTERPMKIWSMNSRDLIGFLGLALSQFKGGITFLINTVKLAGLDVKKSSVYVWMKTVKSGNTNTPIERKNYGGRLLTDNEIDIVVGWIRSRNREKVKVTYKTVRKFVRETFNVFLSESTVRNYCEIGNISIRKAGNQGQDQAFTEAELIRIARDWLIDREANGFFDDFDAKPQDYLCLDFISDTKRRYVESTLGSRGIFFTFFFN